MKKIVFLFLLFLIHSIPGSMGGAVFAQKQGQGLIDSLLTLLPKTIGDSNKIRLFNHLSYSYQSISPDEGIKYSLQALTLAVKLNWRKEIAIANEMTGINYFCESNYAKALEYYAKALKIARELKYKSGIADITGRFGVVYTEESNFAKALEYDLKALKMAEEIGSDNGKAYVLWDMGNIYAYQNDYPKALEYFNQSLPIYEKLNDKEGVANNLNDLGYVYYMKDYYECQCADYFSKSLDYFSRALEIDEKYGYKRGITKNEQGIGINYGDAKDDYVKAIGYLLQSLKIAEDIGYKRLIVWNLGNIGEYYLDIAKDTTGKIFPDSLKDKKKVLDMASVYINKGIEIAKEKGEVNAIGYFYQDLSETQKQEGNYKEALESYIQHALFNDSAHSLESNRKIAGIENKEAMELQASEIRRQKIIRNSVGGGLTIMILFSLVVYRQRNRIAKQRNRIEIEKKRSEELLLNILPAETAEELKETGTAKARSYELVTVMFTDFKNFTKASENMTAEELVQEINKCYSKFDKIITKHGIEKIKTIGDSYMCAGGLPVENKTNPFEVVNAALDILKFIEKEKKERIKNQVPYFEIRIGIHTGPVVAGIVGIKKFAYDIWGDTVNIASRMESSGEVGKVNVSGVTYELIKNRFTCTHRGKIEAKNKGMIDMYFVSESLG